MSSHCNHLIPILDWSHIGRKFKNTEQKLPNEFHERLESAKWSLWHGDTNKCLEKINDIRKSLPNNFETSKLDNLKKYIVNNIKYIINYEQQKNNALPYTSSAIESEIDNLINERQKRTRKMQWTRAGAHHVLQIRASKRSHTWAHDWDKAFEILCVA